MPKPKTIPPMNEVKLHFDGCGIGAGFGEPVVVDGDMVVLFGASVVEAGVVDVVVVEEVVVAFGAK